MPVCFLESRNSIRKYDARTNPQVPFWSYSWSLGGEVNQMSLDGVVYPLAFTVHEYN
jgi:hypothetical protein